MLFQPNVKYSSWDGIGREDEEVSSGTWRFVIGPKSYQWIDVSLDGEGGISVLSGDSLRIEPKVSNRVVITVPEQ